MVRPTRLCRAFAPYQMKPSAAFKAAPEPTAHVSNSSFSPLLLAALERVELADKEDECEGRLLSSNPPSPLSSVPSSPLSSAPPSPRAFDPSEAFSPIPLSPLSSANSSPLSSAPPSPPLPLAPLPPLPPPLLATVGNSTPSVMGQGCAAPSARSSAECARQKRAASRRRKEQRRRVASGKAASKPYRPKASVLKRHEDLAAAAVKRCVKQLPVSNGGAWIGKRVKDEPEALREVEGLVRAGFTIHHWDGRKPELFVDADGCIMAALAGRPNDPGWDGVASDAAKVLQRFRERGVRGGVFHTKDLSHRRGQFLAVATGVSYGGGQTRPGNLCHSRRCRRLLSAVLKSASVRRIAGFQSSILAFYAPKIYAYAAQTLKALFASQPNLRHNFKNSIFPAMSINCGPATECEKHVDSGNAPLMYCAITALGRYDPRLGGHLILYSLKKIIEFPPGSSILIPSASVPHGNTPIQPGETRMSVTQYCAGGLLRWVEYGFRSAKTLLSETDGKQKKKAFDGTGGSRWLWALGLFSKAAELVADRKKVFNL